MMDLLAESRQWKRQAEKLLIDSKLEQVLAAYGYALPTGSFAYDLMLGPDIDLYVLLPMDRARAAATRALQGLIEQNYWNGYLFYDWAAHSSVDHPEFPKAYYVGLKATKDDVRWKVDIWFGDTETLHPQNDWVTSSLTDKTKQAILALKHARNAGTITANSHTIYAAVLNHSIHSLPDFQAWQTNNARLKIDRA